MTWLLVLVNDAMESLVKIKMLLVMMMIAMLIVNKDVKNKSLYE